MDRGREIRNKLFFKIDIDFGVGRVDKCNVIEFVFKLYILNSTPWGNYGYVLHEEEVFFATNLIKFYCKFNNVFQQVEMFYNNYSSLDITFCFAFSEELQ